MKNLLELFEAGLTSIPTIGMWETERRDYSNFKTNDEIISLYEDWAEGDFIDLSNEEKCLLVEAFKNFAKDEEENFFNDDSRFYNDYGQKLENIELRFKKVTAE